LEPIVVDKVLDFLTLNKVEFHTLSLRGRVVMSQLPLSVTTALLTMGISVVPTPIPQEATFRLGVALSIGLLAACFLVPWKKLPYPTFLIVPVLDFIPIGLLREGVGTNLTGLGLLAAFPVIWLASSGQFPRLSVVAGVLGSLAMVWIPVFFAGAPVTPEALARPLLIPVMMLAIGITIQVMTASMMQQQRAVESKDAELRGLLEASDRRERLLRAVMDAVDVGVLAIDEHGNDVLINRRQQQIHRLGLPDGAEDAAEAGLRLYGDGGTSPLPAEHRPARRAIRGETFSEYLIWIGQAPRQRVLSTSARVMTDSNGRREGSVLAFSDVTELVAALNAKNEFLSSVSHELRTPLTSIRGYAELLSMTEGLPGNVASGLDVITRNSHQLLNLVNDLLGTAAGFSELQPVRTDFGEIVGQAVAAAEPRAAAAGVKLFSQPPETLPVECDPGRIRQVLDNLLSNAIKYSPQGGIVTVSCSARNGTVECSVTDTGMGLSPEDSKGLFTRFFRSAAARNSSIPGLGLGLALSKDIVERHGGTIACESDLGEGTVFTFTLPVTGQLADANTPPRQPPREE
jgi:two-component system phosphate regulon sensor histidine kinase PhoR